MTRPVLLLQQLLRNLRGWEARIRRGSGASRVEFFATAPTGEFTVRITWEYNGASFNHEQLFDRSYVFGTTARLTPDAYQYTKKVCDFVRDLLEAVIDKRKAQLATGTTP